MNTVDLLKEVLSSISGAGLQLESLQLEDVVGVWTNLWHQAGAGVRMGKVKACSGRFAELFGFDSLSEPFLPALGIVDNLCSIKTLCGTAGDTSAMDGE